MTARAQLSLNGQWRFRIDREERGETRGWHTRDYDPADWLAAAVPGTWDTYLPELFGYAGHAWYRREFDCPPEWNGRRLHMRFEGANYAATVWLDGVLIGNHAGGFDPFVFDVTDALAAGGQHTLAVRVDNLPRVGRVPNGLAGWWNYGGIYRDVTLLALPDARIADVVIHAEPVGAGARIEAEITLINESREPARLGMLARIEGTAEISAPTVDVAPGATTRVAISSTLAHARTWSPNDPHLYRLSVQIAKDTQLIDQQDVSFGVRRFEVRGTQCLLNGAPIVLSGLNRHEEYAGSGRIDPGGILEADLRLIKSLGGTMVRMHYQALPELYDLADRLGLLVFAEIPLWQVGVKDLKEWEDPIVWQTAETMLRTLIGDLKNHPSVVIWSVGNECATNRDEARPLIGHLAGVARALDTTRPIAYVTMYGLEERCFDLVDLPCVNTYFGLNTARLEEYLDRTHTHQPQKPLLIAEFGHESVLGLHGDGYGAEQEQSEVIERMWQVFHERREYIPGALIWCLADYWHMPMGPEFRWLNRIYFCHGLTTLDRRPKLAVETVRRLWQE